jgi:hypothetical protein
LAQIVYNYKTHQQDVFDVTMHSPLNAVVSGEAGLISSSGPDQSGLNRCIELDTGSARGRRIIRSVHLGSDDVKKPIDH